MLKILRNRCEADVSPDSFPGTVQCNATGKARKFTDGAFFYLCDMHWADCFAVVQLDGKSHSKPLSQAVGE